MRFKGTFVLLIVCLALGGYLYFYEIKGGQQREKAKQIENQLWNLEEKDIQQIDFISPNKNITAVRKSDTEWLLTAPHMLDADSNELNRLAGSAAKIRRETVLEQNAKDLAKFGLSPSQSSLRLKTKKGKEYAVNFGNNNPTGSFTYAVLSNSSDVLLIPRNTASDFGKKLDDLRNHSVLNFEQSSVQSLSLQNPKGRIELYKDSNDRWWFKGIEARAADAPEIRGILNALSMGKIKEFFNENANDYKNLGFDKPFIDVRLTHGKNNAIKHLIIGQEKTKLQKKASKKTEREDNKQDRIATDGFPELYLAKDASRDDLFFIEKDLINKLLKSPDDAREKALVPFQRWDVDFIALTNTKGSLSFTKSGGEWLLSGTKKKAKWDAVNGILDAMEKPVKEWIDKPAPLSTYGINTPIIRLIFKQGGNIIADCSFGKAAKNGIYAQTKGDPSIKIADPDGLHWLNRSESDFIEVPASGTQKNK